MKKIASLGTESLSFGLRLTANIPSYELTEATIHLVDPHAERLAQDWLCGRLIGGCRLGATGFGY